MFKPQRNVNILKSVSCLPSSRAVSTRLLNKDQKQQQASLKEQPNRKLQIPIKTSQDLAKKYPNDGTYFHEKLIIGYSREQMCDLVYDVKNYKSFVPFCADSDILSEPQNMANLNLKLSKNNMSLNLRNFDSNTDKQLHLPQHFRAKLEIGESFTFSCLITFYLTLKLTGYPPIKESYVSHVSMIRPNIVKSISRDTTLFEFLVNEWKFHPNPHTYELEHLNSMSDAELKSLENSCLLEFYVSFKFNNKLYSKFSQIFMDQIFKKMVQAFTDRAKVLYGEPSCLSEIVN